MLGFSISETGFLRSIKLLDCALIKLSDERFCLKAIDDTIAALSKILNVNPSNLIHIADTYFLLIGFKKSLDRLLRVYGVEKVVLGYLTELTELEKTLEAIIKEIYEFFSRERLSLKTFRVLEVGILSPETLSSIIEILGKKLGAKLVQSNEDIKLWIASKQRDLFIGFREFSGLGGSLLETGRKAVCLVSGGPDSTLALLLTSRIGMKTIGVYYDFGAEDLREKARNRVIESLRLVSKRWGRIEKLYIVPFVDVVANILSYAEPKNFFVLLKRYMIRLAEKICERDKCDLIVTGEIIGEHASQTLWNLEIITEASSSIPIIRPLLTWDKTEILNYLRKIDKDVYDIVSSSIEPCVVSREIKPTTKADLESILRDEDNISIDEEFINKLLEKSFIILLK